MKIIFSDFDGTLVEKNKLKNKADISAIKKFREEGNLFVICTGRCLQEIQRDLPKYNIPYDYLILNNGSQIIDQNFNIIYNKTINKDIGKEILNQLLKYKDMWVYFTCEQYSYGMLNHVVTNQLTGKQENVDFIQSYKKASNFNILCFVQENYKTDIILNVIEELKSKYSKYVEIYLNTCFVDIVAKGCSKGNGIHLLKEILNAPATTFAIGDSYNDLPMIRAANKGYTFKNVDISKEINNQVDSIEELIKEIEGE